MKNYEKESHTTKNHILLHAVYWELFIRIFNKRRLNKHIKFDEKHEDYRKAWEIVQNTGYENIINEFKKRLK